MGKVEILAQTTLESFNYASLLCPCDACGAAEPGYGIITCASKVIKVKKINVWVRFDCNKLACPKPSHGQMYPQSASFLFVRRTPNEWYAAEDSSGRLCSTTQVSTQHQGGCVVSQLPGISMLALGRYLSTISQRITVPHAVRR